MKLSTAMQDALIAIHAGQPHHIATVTRAALVRRDLITIGGDLTNEGRKVAQALAPQPETAACEPAPARCTAISDHAVYYRGHGIVHPPFCRWVDFEWLSYTEQVNLCNTDPGRVEPRHVATTGGVRCSQSASAPYPARSQGAYSVEGEQWRDTLVGRRLATLYGYDAQQAWAHPNTGRKLKPLPACQLA